jgi:hypothetical protein
VTLTGESGFVGAVKKAVSDWFKAAADLCVVSPRQPVAKQRGEQAGRHENEA